MSYMKLATNRVRYHSTVPSYRRPVDLIVLVNSRPVKNPPVSSGSKSFLRSLLVPGKSLNSLN